MYSDVQLRRMARLTIAIKQSGDGRYALLIQRLAARTGLHPLQCEIEIRLLANAH